MISLLNEAESVRHRLERADNARGNIDEVQELERLLKVTEGFSQKLNQLAYNAELLRKEGLTLTPIPTLPKVIKLVNEIKNKFVENKSSQTLKQGRRWSGLTNQLKSLSQDVYQSQKSDWLLYFDNNYFGGVSPAQKEPLLLRTPENNKSIELYKELYDRFNRFKSKPPRNMEEFGQLRDLSYQLSAIEFEEDAPESVRKFLAATNTGAELELLTSEVMDWLRNNNLLNSYVVRTRNI